MARSSYLAITFEGTTERTDAAKSSRKPSSQDAGPYARLALIDVGGLFIAQQRNDTSDQMTRVHEKGRLAGPCTVTISAASISMKTTPWTLTDIARMPNAKASNMDKGYPTGLMTVFALEPTE